MPNEDVPRDDETLAEYIKRRRSELGLSQRDVWRKGGADEWSHFTPGNIESGKIQNPAEKTLERLAIALETTPNRLRALVGRRRHGKPFTLPPRSAALSARERQVVLDVVDGLLGKFAEDVPEPRSRPRSLRAVEIPEPPTANVAARRGRSRGKDAIRAQDDDAERGDDPTH